MHSGVGEGELSDCRKKKKSQVPLQQNTALWRREANRSDRYLKNGAGGSYNSTGEVAFAAVPKQEKIQLFLYPACQGNAQEYMLQLQTAEHCHGAPRTRHKTAWSAMLVKQQTLKNTNKF